jgi:hypothetical protein
VSTSNVIDLRDVFEKKHPAGDRPKCFASTRETIELLQAFSRIESPFLRGAIIKTAREAASTFAPAAPPKSSA